MLSLLFNTLDIHFIENFIDSFLNKDEIEELGKIFIRNKFLSNFLKKFKNIWEKKLSNLELNYILMIKKNPRFNVINYYHYLKNIHNNQYLSIILPIIKLNKEKFNNSDLYPGYTRSCYSFCDNVFYSCSTNTEILFKIYKNINKKEYKNVLEIFNYCKKYFLSDKIRFVYNSDYISLNTVVSSETQVIDKNNNPIHFLNKKEKIDFINNNIDDKDYHMIPFIYESKVIGGLYILKFYINLIKIK
jgi:hypothetical protein